MWRLIVPFGFLLLVGCKSYDFAQNGYVINGDPYYQNVDKKLTLELFEDYAVYASTLGKGVRTDVLYPGQRKLLKRLGLSPSNTEILFSAEPIRTPFYRVISYVAKDNKIDTSAYVPHYLDGQRYLFRKIVSKGMDVFDAVFPVGQKSIGLIYYSPNIQDTTYYDFERLIRNNIRTARKDGGHFFLPDKTHIPCGDEHVGSIEVEIPQEKRLKGIYALINIYNIADIDKRKLAVYTLINPDQLPLVAFKVCKGRYLIEYTDLKHNLVWSEEREI